MLKVRQEELDAMREVETLKQKLASAERRLDAMRAGYRMVYEEQWKQFYTTLRDEVNAQKASMFDV